MTYRIEEPALVSLMVENPAIVRVIRNVLDYEQNTVPTIEAKQQVALGLQWGELGAPVHIIRRLVERGIMKVSYKSRSFTHYRLAISIEEAKKAIEEMDHYKPPTEEDLIVPDDLFSVIEGFDDIKRIVSETVTAPKPVHILLVGTPSTAKSLFLMELARIKGARYATGYSSTAAGITRFLMEFTPKLLLIDELDKMRWENYASLLTVMETGTVAELKAERTETRQLDLRVYATANREDKLSPELRSRFLIFRIKPYTLDQYIRVATKVLTDREDVERKLARHIARTLATVTTDIRAAVRMARLAKNKRDVNRLLGTMDRYGGFTSPSDSLGKKK